MRVCIVCPFIRIRKGAFGIWAPSFRLEVLGWERRGKGQGCEGQRTYSLALRAFIWEPWEREIVHICTAVYSTTELP